MNHTTIQVTGITQKHAKDEVRTFEAQMMNLGKLYMFLLDQNPSHGLTRTRYKIDRGSIIRLDDKVLVCTKAEKISEDTLSKEHYLLTAVLADAA